MGSAGEGGALNQYSLLLAQLMADGATETDEVVINVRERMADELNHILGDVRDAVKVSNFKISPDGLRQILDDLWAARADS